MKLGGLQKTTLVDYPGKVACTVFTVGCNFRCPYCYNPELVLPAGSPSARLQSPDATPAPPKSGTKTASTQYDSLEFFNFLKARTDQLEGVCICGGEPTIHDDLPEFCQQVKELGFAVKLDTNGSNPKLLKRLIDDELVDYVALDIKAPRGKYAELAGAKLVGAELASADVKVGDIENSVAVLKASGIVYELRTTVVPTLLTKADVVAIAKWIGPADKYFIQGFQPKTPVDPKLAQVEPYSEAALKEMRDAVASQFRVCKIR